MSTSSASVTFPALRLSASRCLPLADATAAAMLRTALDETQEPLVARWAALAEVDPGLAVWWWEQGERQPGADGRGRRSDRFRGRPATP